MTVDFVQQSPSATEDPFEFYWNQQGEWVEEPNQRRGGESGVQRIHDGEGRLLYAKRQVGHTYRSWRSRWVARRCCVNRMRCWP